MATHTTFNHPPGDLFEGDYIRDVVPLYRGLDKEDFESAKAILQDHEYLVGYSITGYKETPLHVAIMRQLPTEFVRHLVSMMTKTELELQNRDGNTAFCLAAISGNVDMAKIMVEKNPDLQIIYGTENTMPLCLAAFHKRHDMVDFLYGQSDGMKADGWTRERRNEVLLKCVEANMFEVAIRILKDNEELPQDKHVWDVLRVLAEKPEAFHENKSPIYWPFTDVVTRPPILLLRLVLERVTENMKDSIHEIPRGPMIEKDKMETYPSQILFIAAKMNNKQFLVELIREYPGLIWQRNDDGQTIFHIAVAHRNADVYDLLYDMGSMKDFITPIADKEGNNILHMVGKIPEKISYKDSETTPYEILSEYFWYQKVESTLPSPCRQVKNKKGHTPEDAFIENHREAVFEGINWIYETINQSMVVAALVCTIGFSIVYSLPGGFDQNSGFPIFRRSKIFICFIILDAASFSLSSISILAFISIILGRCQRKEKIIQRWVTAQQTLIASLGTIITAFIFSLFLLYPNSKLPYIISAAAFVLVGIYIKEHKSFLKSSLYITIVHRVLLFFRPRKPMIYYENPKV